MVGDRGMITSARIAALNQQEDGTPRPRPLRVDHRAARPGHQEADGRRRPAADDPVRSAGPGRDHHPDFPGERLVACRNPVLAADRARKREDLLAATEKLLAPVIARVQAGRLAGAGPIGVEVGKVISKYKTGKHFDVTITDTALPRPAGRTRSTPKPPWTASTCCAPPSPPATWTPPPW